MNVFGVSVTTILIVLAAYLIGARYPVIAQKVGLA